MQLSLIILLPSVAHVFDFFVKDSIDVLILLFPWPVEPLVQDFKFGLLVLQKLIFFFYTKNLNAIVGRRSYLICLLT